MNNCAVFCDATSPKHLTILLLFVLFPQYTFGSKNASSPLHPPCADYNFNHSDCNSMQLHSRNVNNGVQNFSIKQTHDTCKYNRCNPRTMKHHTRWFRERLLQTHDTYKYDRWNPRTMKHHTRWFPEIIQQIPPTISSTEPKIPDNSNQDDKNVVNKQSSPNKINKDAAAENSNPVITSSAVSKL